MASEEEKARRKNLGIGNVASHKIATQALNDNIYSRGTFGKCYKCVKFVKPFECDKMSRRTKNFTRT